jgi:hypothetical protein
MRLVDAILRQGHLSERTLVEALMTGDRPLHLDRCDICATRAVEMNRWLDAVKTAAVEAADEAFPQERLAAQQLQIQRRLEQLDEPARVLTFPRQPRLDQRDAGRRRVAPAWVGVAAAAGLVIGVIGGQAMARLNPPLTPVPAAPAAAVPAPDAAEPVTAGAPWAADLEDVDAFMPDALSALNVLTPRAVTVASR